MNKIKQLEKQIIKERKELHKLDGMDWFIKAAHIQGLYGSIVLHTISQPNPNLTTLKKEVKPMKGEDMRQPLQAEIPEETKNKFKIRELESKVKKLETTVNVLVVISNIYAKANGIKIEQIPGDTRLIVISQI